MDDKNPNPTISNPDREKRKMNLKQLVFGPKKQDVLPSFSEVDSDGNGAIDRKEFRKLYPADVSDTHINREFEKWDLNRDGKLDRSEYMKMKALKFAEMMILPKTRRTQYLCQSKRQTAAAAAGVTPTESVQMITRASRDAGIPLPCVHEEEEDSDLTRSQDSHVVVVDEELSNKWRGAYRLIKDMEDVKEPIHRELDSITMMTTSAEIPVDTPEFVQSQKLLRAEAEVSDAEMAEKLREAYSCCPPPIFMFIITVIELCIFGYHVHTLKEQGYVVNKYGPAPTSSVLIYDPYKRYEVWRYLTYMFVHSGYLHVLNNVIMQLFLGILLELVHKWRVLVIYFAGVLAGSLATSVYDPGTFLAGASGGVYALIFAHISTVILNWSEMEAPWLRVILFIMYCAYDIGMALYYNVILGVETNVGYASHIGGGIAGLLIGIYILKNLKWEKWEAILWWISVAAAILLSLFAIAWNVFNRKYYP